MAMCYMCCSGMQFVDCGSMLLRTPGFFLLNTDKGLEPKTAPVEARPPTPTVVVPPHDQGGGHSGVGAVGEPEDSLMNCLHLVAKAPQGGCSQCHVYLFWLY